MNRRHLHVVRDPAVVVDTEADYAAGLANTRAFAKAAPLGGNVSVPTQVLLRLLHDHDDFAVEAARAGYLQKSVTAWCSAVLDVAAAAGIELAGVVDEAVADRIKARIKALEVDAAHLKRHLEEARQSVSILTGFGR